MKENVLGIIGGMGPEATVDLMTRIIKITPAKRDQDHIRMLVDNNPKIPCRVKALLGDGENPGPVMAEMGRNLEKAGADILVIPCNTAHYYINDVINAVNIPVLNMIDETVNVLKNDGTDSVALLASTAVLKTGLYEAKIFQFGLNFIVPDQLYQEKLMETIFLVKSNEISKAKENIAEIIEHIKQKGAKSIILGCTELPIIVDENSYNLKFYNPTQILVQAIVREV